MPELEASRTLVKSAPELWAECSDGASLARHLGAFGEIRITKLEPETSVAWEGDEVRGTVTLEPSGWGTRVVLTATPERAPEAIVETPPHQYASPAEDPPQAEVPQPVSSLPELSAPDASDAPQALDDPAAPAAREALDAPRAPAPEAESPEPVGFFGRLMARLRGEAPLGQEQTEAEVEDTVEAPPETEAATGAASALTPSPEPVTAPEPEPAPASQSTPELEALIGALESLGTAHRRPFSRG
jgi:hypothetical protein